MLTRRVVLASGLTVAGAAGIAVLAGCGAGSGGAGGAAAAPAGPASSVTAGVVLASVSDIPVGGSISATLDGKPILISRPSTGEIVAFTAICTHMGCTVMPAGKEFHCPCHGSVYNAATGAVLQGPAPAPLAKIPTDVADGEVRSVGA